MYGQCEHEFKHNEDKDIVFCVKCGDRWEKGKIEYIPQYPIGDATSGNMTPHHYHNGHPCYNNPCYWAGN